MNTKKKVKQDGGADQLLDTINLAQRIVGQDFFKNIWLKLSLYKLLRRERQKYL
jgi:hypothetical protein